MSNESPSSRDKPPTPFTIRTDLRPGDIGTIVLQHGLIYARERGFDITFEAYVAGPLSQFVLSRTPRDCLWIAEQGGEFTGCIAIVGVNQEQAQLRWFLVDPSTRGSGLGKWLLNEAVAFAEKSGYKSVILWTESSLAPAAHLYRMAGFQKVESKPGQWGVTVVEEKYVLQLQPYDRRGESSAHSFK